VLLQVLDEGRLTDAKGRIVNFKNTIIILTSNIGSHLIEKMETLGFSNNSKVDEYAQTKDKVLASLKDHFRPEFLNRLDDIIVFDILPMDVIRHIVDIKMGVIKERLLSKNIELEISPDALTYLAKEGYDPHYGARPLSRLIQNKILNPIASFIISKGVKKGDSVTVVMKDNDLSIEMKKKKIKSNFKVAKPSPYNK
jgi:ATP-dependent Clp protease ATP-binding subunit ClpA